MNLLNLYRNGLQNTSTRWLFVLLTFVYFLSPIDLIPDFIPFLGQIDDFALLVVFGIEMFKILTKPKSSNTPKPKIIDVDYTTKE
jgi:uncharacterized membrane protein YkvA (DUF1232 family)